MKFSNGLVASAQSSSDPCLLTIEADTSLMQRTHGDPLSCDDHIRSAKRAKSHLTKSWTSIIRAEIGAWLSRDSRIVGVRVVFDRSNISGASGDVGEILHRAVDIYARAWGTKRTSSASSKLEAEGAALQ